MIKRFLFILTLLFALPAGAANTTLPLLSASTAVDSDDIFLCREDADIVDNKCPGSQIATMVISTDAILEDLVALTDPNADRIPFWDDSDGNLVWMDAGTGLSISGTTLSSTITQYTDEMAQDAIGAMVNTSLTYTDGGPTLALTSRTIGGTAFDGTANIVPSLITMVDSTDATSSVLIADSATGDLQPKTDAGLSYAATTGVLTATGFAGPLTGNVTGNADTVTTNANLTGEVTSIGNAATVADSVTVATWTMTGAPGLTVSNGATSAGSINFVEDNDNGSNTVTLIANASMGTDRTLTLPNATDTLSGRATTDTFTNKTIDAEGTGNVITNIGTSEIQTDGVSADELNATGVEAELETELDIAGDVSSTGMSTTVIGADKVLESMLKAVDAASDEECLTYETTTGDFEWQSCGGAVDTKFVEYRGITTTDTVGTADISAVVQITGANSFTLSFSAIATLGDKSWGYIKHLGTGIVTLDPNGAETIDGVATWELYPGGAVFWYNDNSVLRTILISPMQVTYNASGTFVTPPTATNVRIEAWGGGGSGGRGGTGDGGGGGAGGAYCTREMLRSALAATITVTIGAGGPAQTSDSTDGTIGGNSTFGAHLTGYGGGAGGGDNTTGSHNGGGGGGGCGSAGATASGATGGTGGTEFGATSPGSNVYNGRNGVTGTGAPGTATSSYFAAGGGGGGSDTGTGGVGGSSAYGGASGGGGGDSAGGAAGTTVYGGAAGAGNFDASVGGSGTQPGGGGGGSEAANSGAGADGRIVVTVW